MKRYALALLGLILASQFVLSQTAGETTETKIEAILLELSGIVRPETHELVADTVDCVLSRIQQGTLRVVVEPDSEEETLGQATFSYYLDEPDRAPYISINEKTLGLYPSRISLLMALLVHEFKHACDYFTYTSWYIEHRDNILETYLYDMDALYVEVLFIKECVLSSAYAMTKLEKF